MSKYWETDNQNEVYQNEGYQVRNDRPVTEELFRLFNTTPDLKGGEQKVDDYEQKNLRTILDRLNRAEAENRKLTNELSDMRKQNDQSIIRNLARVMVNDCAEVTVSFKMKKYFDE